METPLNRRGFCMYTVETLSSQVVEGNSRRKHFERTPEQYAEQILDEARELVSEIQEAMVTDNIMGVVGEIGDLYVLLAQLCHDLGVNPADAMHYKVVRNQYKYPDHTMDNGYTTRESFEMSKRFYREIIGGDAVFSHAYLDYLADEPGDGHYVKQTGGVRVFPVHKA